jgi:hypothetical protein
MMSGRWTHQTTRSSQARQRLAMAAQPGALLVWALGACLVIGTCLARPKFPGEDADRAVIGIAVMAVLVAVRGASPGHHGTDSDHLRIKQQAMT